MAAGTGASANFVPIDDPVATYGQQNIPVSLTLKKAPIMDVDVELPFSVKTMDFQRWMPLITDKEAKLFVKFLADRGGKPIVCSFQFFGEDDLYLLSHLIASGALRKDPILPSATSFRPFLKLC